MSDELAIEVRNLGKTYQIWSSPSARFQAPVCRRLARLPLMPAGAAVRLRERASVLQREFHALHGVSFKVLRGHSVGLVGRNGSGKSTLLQMIAGTLQPTEGSVAVHGRIGALLELGSCFNPEFTGRENAMLSATVVGFTEEQLAERFADILAFAEIGDFIDQPVKTYSSGMMLRLAFAVNIHLEPEILIIDEALAVGDAAFSRKCIGRIEQFKRDGGTLLFVSHDPGSVVTLCDHAVLLEKGEMILEGTPKLVTSQYYKLLFAPADRYDEVRKEIAAEGDTPAPVPAANGASAKAAKARAVAFYVPDMVSRSVISYPPQGAQIELPKLLDAEGKEVNMLVRGDLYTYVYQVFFSAVAFRVRFGILIKTLGGIELGGAGAGTEEQVLPMVEAGKLLTIRYTFECRLLPGVYFMNAGVSGIIEMERRFLHRLVDAYLFRVQDEAALRLSGFVDFGMVARVFDEEGREIFTAE